MLITKKLNAIGEEITVDQEVGEDNVGCLGWLGNKPIKRDTEDKEIIHLFECGLEIVYSKIKPEEKNLRPEIKPPESEISHFQRAGELFYFYKFIRYD